MKKVKKKNFITPSHTTGIKKLAKPVEYNGKWIHYVNATTGEMPFYYIYDSEKKQIGGGLFGTVSVRLID
jgi:hypothetical protein